MTEYDFDKITDVAIIIIVIGGIIALGWTMQQSIAKGAYVTQCKTNPASRYGQACNGDDDCIQKCADRLYNQAINNKKNTSQG